MNGLRGKCFHSGVFFEIVPAGKMHWNNFFVRLRRRGWELCFPLSRVYLFLALAGAFIGAGQDSFAAISAEFRPDQILIQPKKNVNSTALARFHAAQQSQVVKTFASLNRLQVLRVPKNETVAGLIAKYQKSGLVEFAEPDYMLHADASPNDPYYVNGTLWWLNNTGQNGGVAGADIKTPQAWDILNSAGKIVVAVVDSGVRATHEDLAANMWINPVDGGHGFNAFTGTNDPTDDFGHGTQVAGILGAVGDNGLGITGVAWEAQIMACKCLDNTGNGPASAFIACLDYARTNGARVINASLDTSINSLAISNAVLAVHDAGIILVASCGNGNSLFPHVNVDISPRYPACYPFDNIVSVAYTTRTDDLGAVSFYGPTSVDLGAPGDEVTSTTSGSDQAYFVSTSSVRISGTSFAAPLVAGTCAMMLERYPDETYQQIIARILKATDPLPALAGKCVSGGRLNVWKALSPPISLASVPGTNGTPFQLHLSTGASRICIIESSPDLVNWSPIFTNTTTTNGTFDFVDNDATNAAQRFYRAVSAP
jgi:subtilisin family serine protease